MYLPLATERRDPDRYRAPLRNAVRLDDLDHLLLPVAERVNGRPQPREILPVQRNVLL